MDANRNTFTILAGRLFDPSIEDFVASQVIVVSKTAGLIVDVHDYTTGSVDIDLRHLTVLPGFVDAHVYMFLHSYSETSWTDQLTKESLAERTIRATVHARKTLMAGFTTVRDLGTEGAGDADLALRRCLAGPDPIIPGPRYFCANRALVTTGSYGPKSSIHPHSEGVEGITGAEVTDGIDECVKAVRRQVGAGVDWIKIYADYSVRSRVASVSPAIGARAMPTFMYSEIKVMVDIAHALGVKVAGHAKTVEAVSNLLKAGANTIEHGSQMYKDASLMDAFCNSPSTIWIPTLAVYYEMRHNSPQGWEDARTSFQRALKMGMDNISCGGDTGPFPHGDNALEMKLMVRLGGWKCIRPINWKGGQNGTSGDNDIWFGNVKAGWAADLVALEGNLEDDFEGTLDRVSFVMRGGKVYKLDGKAVQDV
ncbi:uncharacterized protein BT62DRAFT_984593 [Guyanagaster necrorhizus]|uniref:Amidohydrolase-related domain-containing protein n=1 Tax=Guyanagaster necrorhizus TaxID=856835 RepID=A0A9P7W3V9_9AGAR|nr:uncharacterized protein BT62DRAFT_984593 [Guyanagaster necrorhizus MCA 3950]KAG7451500.1 hypothetical protein BT62DRAFT_984593 [Guyanagaster necrorhizus MCA 3950]